MLDTVLPIQQIDLTLFQQLLEQLEASINAGNYCQIVRDSSAAIHQVFRSQLLVLFDIRARAQSKQGHYNLACADAQQMINVAPELGAGYARQGDIFSMFGRQRRAIDAYNDGLNNARSDQTQIERLATGKEYVTLKNEARVDYLSDLPAEVTNNIIQRLRKNDKVTCLSVSRAWRERTLGCSAAWKTLKITGNRKDLQLVNVMSHIGCHIENLTINTENDQIRSVCLQHMIGKHLSGIQSLKITALATKDFAPYTARMAIAFWQMRETLTSFDVDVGKNQNVITLADILLPCCNLTDLYYATTLPMALLTGDFSTMERHSSLVNLELKTCALSGSIIKGVLQRCPQLRRLIVTGSTPSVFDPINQYAPNLEILGYNNCSQSIGRQDSMALKPPGLRKIHTNNGRPGVTAEAILPLICKSMTTLETAFLNISAMSEEDVQHFHTRYRTFKLENMAALTLWSNQGIQSIILQAIRDTSTLAYLSLVSVHELSEVASTLMRIPPVSTLQVSYTDTTTAGANLVQLFGRYAALCSTPNTRQLHTVLFRYCTGLTNSVLLSLTDIQSLQRITLRGLVDVSSVGIGSLLERLPHQITYLELAEMSAVTDNHIIALRVHSRLSTVVLQSLPGITDQGLKYAIDNRSAPLTKLTIKACQLISNDCAQYLKRKVKTVIYDLT